MASEDADENVDRGTGEGTGDETDAETGDAEGTAAAPAVADQPLDPKTIAVMAAGWDGEPGLAPGFPHDGSWQVRTEGLLRAP